METFLAILRTDAFLIGITVAVALLLIVYIISLLKQTKIKKEYTKFLKKLGNGNNLEEMLKEYIYKVEDVSQKNKEITAYCHKLDKDISNCLQKVGIVRYSAFKDMGSDLSFALAILDENNDGIVLNGIYSSEISNIYAKPIKKGESTYTISEEEQQAIDMAVKAERIHKVIE